MKGTTGTQASFLALFHGDHWECFNLYCRCWSSSNDENKGSKDTGSKPSISSFSQVATSLSASFLTVQINQVLFSKLNLELQIGSLSIFKESDIKKIFELKQKIAELEQQISVLKARQEQAIEAELINRNANRFKNSNSSMKFRI